MINSKISSRLKYIANEIGQVDSFADIGTDHGLLAIYALQHNISKKVIATDISQKSLNKAKKNIEAIGLSEYVEFYQGDGIDALPFIPQTIVIAGMGGLEIIKIISKYPKVNSRFVLLPHQDVRQVREFLIYNQYRICKDYVIYDRKFYNIIVAEVGTSSYTQSEIILGKNFPQTDEFSSYINYRKHQIDNILDKNEVSYQNLKEELREEYVEILKWLKLQKS